MKKKSQVFSANRVAYSYSKPITFRRSKGSCSENILNKTVRFSFPDVLSVIAQGSGPGAASSPASGPGPSDEKLHYDDDTLRGERITLSTLLILHLNVFYTF